MASRLGIVGGGNMGQAIVRGVIDAAVLPAAAVVVADVDATRRRELERLGCRVVADPAAVLESGEIMLAVKPQSFPAVAARLGPLAEPKVVITIMAGLGSRAVRRALGPKARVVRVMPNTPCRVGEGMTAISLGEGSRPGDERLAREIFEALGTTVQVEEASMHAVTAVSGSGPAYVFLLVEAMEAAGRAVGLDAPVAALLARRTVIGAAAMLEALGDEPADLRRAVTSPGGTTEAAISVMEDRDLAGIVAVAIAAARDRGVELDRAG